MNHKDLQVMLDYHYWARDRMLDALEPLSAEQFTREMGSSFRSIRATVTHIYFAEWAWYLRWVGDSPSAPLPADMFPDLAALRKAWTEHEAKVRALVEGLGDDGINRVIEYKLLSGTPGASVFWQMLQHVVNHASYHRGQVTTLLREIGAAPPKGEDMIVFYREQPRVASTA
jgi:uncharacterized damage-inducible protein DinB